MRTSPPVCCVAAVMDTLLPTTAWLLKAIFVIPTPAPSPSAPTDTAPVVIPKSILPCALTPTSRPATSTAPSPICAALPEGCTLVSALLILTAERFACALAPTSRIRASSEPASMRPTVSSLACASASWFTLRLLPSCDNWSFASWPSVSPTPYTATPPARPTSPPAPLTTVVSMSCLPRAFTAISRAAWICAPAPTNAVVRLLRVPTSTPPASAPAPSATEPVTTCERSWLRAVTLTSCNTLAPVLVWLIFAAAPTDAFVSDWTDSTEIAPEIPAYSPAAPLATTVNRSSDEVASTCTPRASLRSASTPSPVYALIPAVLLPSAFTVAPPPMAASVVLVMLLTPTAAPMPAAPKPAAAAPATTSDFVSSRAATRTLPPASMRVAPPPTSACVWLASDTTATEPATATVPAAERPTPMSSTWVLPSASTCTSRAALTCAPVSIAASVAFFATNTSAPAPTATAPAPEAAPASPRWNCSLPAATRTDCAAFATSAV